MSLPLPSTAQDPQQTSWNPTRWPMDEIWPLVGLLIVAMIVWAAVDIQARGRIDPNDADAHRTDFTVYTEAGQAFFDGRDPYAISNPRGWHYLYPPMFAILMAPLAELNPRIQVTIWFFISVLAAWGSYRESRRILRVVFENDSVARLRRKMPPEWLCWLGFIGVLFPTANCLQRGQVGVVIIYLLLLGVRLVIQSAGVGRAVLGGMVLAAPVVLKLTPLLPAGFFLLQELARAYGARQAVPGAGRRAWSAATGFGLGMILFVVVLPSLAVGPRANWRHLQTWMDGVIDNSQRGQDLDFNPRSQRNQSLSNAANRFGNWLAYINGQGSLDTILDNPKFADMTLIMPMDRPQFRRGMTAIKGILLLALLVVGWHVARRGDDVAAVGVFGLACVLSLLVSPISWGHHYTMLAPAVAFVPIWLWLHGQTARAVIVAASMMALTLAHYALLHYAGRVGLLGLGSTVWFFGSSLLLVSAPSGAAHVAVRDSDESEDHPAERLRSAA